MGDAYLRSCSLDWPCSHADVHVRALPLTGLIILRFYVGRLLEIDRSYTINIVKVRKNILNTQA